MTDINVGQLSEAINGKMDRDASNIASPKLPIFLVDVQYPTAANNYTWYRKYSDGWVEQGGITNPTVISAGYSASRTLVFPVAMADTNYSASGMITQGNFGSMRITRNTTGATLELYNRAGSGDTSFQALWEVRGMAA